MRRPWMAWYVADYLADTAHLRAAQSGAYLHLIMHYWQHGGLPDNNNQLAAIARMTDSEWKKTRPLIEPFFRMPGWRHKRIDEEIAKAEDKYEKRAAAGRTGGKISKPPKQTGSKTEALLPEIPSQTEAKQNQPQPQPQPQKDGGGVEGATPEPEAKPKPKSMISEAAFALASDVLVAMGMHPHDPLSVGAPLTVQGWFNAGWNAQCITIGVKRGMQSRNGDPPSTLKYFEKAIARAHAELMPAVPVAVIQPQEKINVPAKPETLVDIARRHADAGIQFGPRPTGLREPEGEPTVRMLPQG